MFLEQCAKRANRRRLTVVGVLLLFRCGGDFERGVRYFALQQPATTHGTQDTRPPSPSSAEKSHPFFGVPLLALGTQLICTGAG
jgi:hypothetical protein